MQKRFFTFGEIKAMHILTAAGIIPMSTVSEKDAKWAADYVLQLAEQIKNERANASMELAVNAAL